MERMNEYRTPGRTGLKVSLSFSAPDKNDFGNPRDNTMAYAEFRSSF